jgi:hypothetical protein
LVEMLPLVSQVHFFLILLFLILLFLVLVFLVPFLVPRRDVSTELSVSAVGRLAEKSGAQVA